MNISSNCCDVIYLAVEARNLDDALTHLLETVLLQKEGGVSRKRQKV